MTTILSFGGGVNSAALLVGLRERNERPDAILFADTGGEKPHTYRFVDTMREWCRAQDFPDITVVSGAGKWKTLEENCLAEKMLPSLAYGLRSCSKKFKVGPQDRWCNHWQLAKDTWARGEKVLKYLGIDAGEPHRAKDIDDPKYKFRYPLVEWGWERSDCVETLQRAGLPNPGKSACFFCPASKKREILELQSTYPDLAERAVAMEANANLHTIKGLGNSFSWGSFLRADKAQLKLWPEATFDVPCGCVDESEDD